MMVAEFQLAAVKTFYNSQPEWCRVPLLMLREWIFDAGRDNPTIGAISEEMAWGQPSYVTQETKTGTPLRLGKFDNENIGVYFQHHTRLAACYHAAYGDVVRVHDRGVMVLVPDIMAIETTIRHCITLGLTYHLWDAAEQAELSK